MNVVYYFPQASHPVTMDSVVGNATVTRTCTNAENKSAPACTNTLSCSSAVNTCTTAREGQFCHNRPFT